VTEPDRHQLVHVDSPGDLLLDAAVRLLPSLSESNGYTVET